jgi:hypothetical protein
MSLPVQHGPGIVAIIINQVPKGAVSGYEGNMRDSLQELQTRHETFSARAYLRKEKQCPVDINDHTNKPSLLQASVLF